MFFLCFFFVCFASFWVSNLSYCFHKLYIYIFLCLVYDFLCFSLCFFAFFLIFCASFWVSNLSYCFHKLCIFCAFFYVFLYDFFCISEVF